MNKKRILVSILSFILVMMTLSSAMVVGAAESQTSTVTIQNNATKSAVSLEGKSYGLYKIFDVEVSGEDVLHTVDDDFKTYFTGTLKDGNGADFTFPEVDAEDYSYEVGNYINTFGSSKSKMTTLVKNIRTAVGAPDYTTSGMNATTTEDNEVIETVSITDIPFGYYLILDTTTDVADTNNVVAPGMLVDVVEANVLVTTKASTPVLDKYIWHDDLETNGKWDVVGDHQAGQTVLYKVSSTVPNDYTGYDDYTYIITTQKAPGVDYNHDLKVYAYDTTTSTFDKNHLLFDGTYDEEKFKNDGDGNDNTYTEGYFTVEYPTDGSDDYKLTVDVMKMREDGVYLDKDSIYLSYSGVANKDLGTTGEDEDDTTTLTYSNNPYDSTSTGTYKEVVYHHVFDILVFKTANNTTTPLAGATFGLYRTDGTGDDAVTTQIYVKKDEVQSVDGVVTYHATTEPGASDTEGVIITGETGKFLIYGLNDAITYTIKELDAPKGFNKVAPIDFFITATYNAEGNKLTSLKTDNSAITATDDNSLALTVVNTSKTLLPTTGGMGTSVFMVLGGCLMMGALFVLLMMRKKEEQ